MQKALPMAQLEYDGATALLSGRPSQVAASTQGDNIAEQGLIEFRYRVSGINEEGTGITLSQTFESLVRLLQDEVVTDFALTRTTME